MRWSVVVLQNAILHSTKGGVDEWHKVLLQQLTVGLASDVSLQKHQLSLPVPFHAGPDVNGEGVRLSNLQALRMELLSRLTPNSHSAVAAEQVKAALIAENHSSPLLQSPVHPLHRPSLSGHNVSR